MYKIDIHSHILPKELPDMKKFSGYGGWININRDSNDKIQMIKDNGDFFRSVNENLLNLETRLKEMDETGVKIQVLSTVPVMFSYWAKAKDALYLNQQLNNHIAYCIQEHPTRFVGLGSIPLQNPELAVEELKRCVLDLKLKGVEIGSHVNEWNLDDPRLDCVFKTAQDLDCIVFVHPWDMQCSGRMGHYWLPWLAGMPFETTIAITAMIFGGVFDRFPRLKVCFAHGGGAFPFTIGRIEHGFQVRPDLCAIKINKSPRLFLNRIYVDSLVHDSNSLKFLIETLGEDNVMLGSDYPFPLGESQPGLLAETTLQETTKKKILYENAIKFLNI